MCGGSSKKKAAPATPAPADMTSSNQAQANADAAVQRANASKIVSETEPSSFGSELAAGG